MPPPDPKNPLDLEAEYSNRHRVPGWEPIIRGFERDAVAFRTAREGHSELGVRYGDHPRHFVDIFHPDERDENRPLVVFIHGGYWRSLHPSTFSHLAAGPNAHGFSVAMPAYRLCPEVSVAEIVEDARSACRMLHDRLSAPLVVCGWSAGGHLTACVAATDWIGRGQPAQIVKAGLAISGLFELAPLLRTSINETLGLDKQSADAASPVSWRPTGKRFESFVGDDESSEFHRQTRLIAERWKAHIPTASHVMPGFNHYTTPASLADPGSELTRTLASLCD
jgi:arylformamidase